MGVEWQGRQLGTLGDVGIFSLGRGKNITCGSGGIIVTRSEPIAAAIDERYRRLPLPTPIEMLKDIALLFVLLAFIRPAPVLDSRRAAVAEAGRNDLSHRDFDRAALGDEGGPAAPLAQPPG